MPPAARRKRTRARQARSAPAPPSPSRFYEAAPVVPAIVRTPASKLVNRTRPDAPSSALDTIAREDSWRGEIEKQPWHREAETVPRRERPYDCDEVGKHRGTRMAMSSFLRRQR